MKSFLNRAISSRALGAVFFLLLVPASLFAQMGNDNPTGVSGVYNGNVNTGCSYDPYTGNATRSVTDISVAGAAGAYPLAFSRTMNSRYTVGAGTVEFGASGSWRHSYQWSIEPLVYNSTAPDRWNSLPNVYTVNYPDGRRLSFSQSNSDTRFRAGSGVSDRFQQLANSSGGTCYLLLPDGGKIAFEASVDRLEISDTTHMVMSTFSYQLVAIIDPYGQTTTVSYGASTMTIQAPAGRTLTAYYISTPWNGDVVIDRVVSSDGRSVKYNYGGYQPAGAAVYTALSNVQYLDKNGASYAQAIYAYQPGNTDTNGRPLLSWAIDPMYGGRMWAIAYTFLPGTSGAVYGQLQSENYLDPRTGTVGQVVSSLSGTGTSRTETRGDGPSRTFNYSGGKLVSYTDFKGQPSSISYDGNGFISGFTDARGNTTSYQREGLIGALSILTHPDPEHSTQGYSYATSNGAPYYLQIRGDERGHNTYFSRDPNNFQLTRIDYPDYPNGAYETFAYNGFGQVTTHRMTSGATETNYYDGRGMMWAQANPDGTAYFYYDSLDRLEHVVDRRGKTTWFQYNPRGQMTRLTHIDGTYLQYGYNVDGTLAWTADENHPGAESDANQRTRYGYDDYKRVVSVTNPLNQTTSFVYAQDWANPYNQTTTSIKGAFSPMGKQVHFSYDENWQRTVMRVPPGTDPNDAWTIYDYDPVGNLSAIHDPRGYTTSFGYDERNRRTWMDDPIASDRNNSGHTMNWSYDGMSNLRFQTRADNATSEWRYDAMSRLIDTYGFAAEHTHYDRDLAGNVYQMIDAKSAVYGFGYDAMNRKVSETYPIDSYGLHRTETWHYDAAGNMDLYKAPVDLYKTIVYDDRNRPTESSWNNYGMHVNMAYDAAGRVTSIVTNGGETTVAFGYDDANRKVWEDQTVAGYPTRRITTHADADGLRADLSVTTGSTIDYGVLYYDYTQRGQLADIKVDPSTGSWFQFRYDASGNMIKRQDVWNNVGDSMNLPSQYYDGLNRPTMSEQTQAGDVPFARSWYQYDSIGREVATWRDEQAAKGERYSYGADGQLTSARYDADQVWTAAPQNALRTVDYYYSADRLNRTQMNDSGQWTSYNANGMNQYVNVNGSNVPYDQNFNLYVFDGWRYDYDADKHLILTAKGSTSGQFVYDGLGRCVKRTINGVPMLITYDGWKPIVEWDGGGNLSGLNVYGAGADEILYRYVAATNTRFRYHHDIHGNVTFVLDWTGNQIVEKYTYDAYGTPKVTDGAGAPVEYADHTPRSAIGNRFMFNGREYLQELGIYDYRFRMYHPALGRFLQSDPLGFGGGDANLFRFCGGDPVNRRDPLGLASGSKTYTAEQIDAMPSAGPVDVHSTELPDYDPSAGDRTGTAPGEGSGTDGDRGSFSHLNANAREAANWIDNHHPELNLRERVIKEGPLPPPGGKTDWRTGEITIDPKQLSTIEDYVYMLAHEAMHANDSWWQRIWDGWLEGNAHHDAIGRAARDIRNEYLTGGE